MSFLKYARWTAADISQCMNSPSLLSSRIILHAKHARCRRPLARLSKSRCLHKPNFTSSGVSLIRHVSTTFVLYYLVEEGQSILTNCSARRQHRLWPRSSQDHRLCGGGDRGGQWWEDLCIVYNIYIVFLYFTFVYSYIELRRSTIKSGKMTRKSSSRGAFSLLWFPNIANIPKCSKEERGGGELRALTKLLLSHSSPCSMFRYYFNIT